MSSTLTNDQIGTVVNNDLDGSLLLSLPATFVILLIAFGAVVAAVVPLVLAVTSLLAAFGLLGIYSKLFDPVSPYATQLVVLIGLAVAVDYSLFMVTRFRSERRAGRAKLGAIETASATAGRAVFFSGLAVMISVGRPVHAARRAVPLDGPRHDRGDPGRDRRQPDVPAGDPGDPGRRRRPGRVPFLGRERGEGGGHLGGARPGGDAPAVDPRDRRVGVLLLALASPVLRLQLGETDVTSFPESVDGVQAVEAAPGPLAGGHPADARGRRDKRPGAGATKAAIADAWTEVLAIPGLSGPAKVTPSRGRPAALSRS